MLMLAHSSGSFFQIQRYKAAIRYVPRWHVTDLIGRNHPMPAMRLQVNLQTSDCSASEL